MISRMELSPDAENSTRERPRETACSRRTIWNALGLAWLSANVWASLPVHEDSGLVKGMVVGVAAANPILFYLMGWMRRRSRAVSTIAWPGLVVVAWVPAPAFGAANRWGWDCFIRFLVRPARWYMSAYSVFCLALYFVGAFAGRRNMNGPGGSAAEKGEGCSTGR